MTRQDQRTALDTVAPQSSLRVVQVPRHVTGRIVLTLCALLLAAALSACVSEDGSRTPVSDDGAGTPPPAAPQVLAPIFDVAGGVFTAPLRVHVAAGGWLLVTDPSRRTVLRVDPVTLRPDMTLRLPGTPLGVTMLGPRIYVGLQEAGAVAVYTHKGEPKGYLAEPGSVAHPSDLSVDEGTQQVFVLDGVARDVKVFHAPSRTFEGSIGAGSLLSPSGVAVDAERQEVLVSDYGSTSVSASVQVFSYAEGPPGTLVATLSGEGACGMMGCSGGFSRPRGSAVAGGRIYVPDALLGQVLVLDRATGERSGVLGSGDPATGALRVPSDVAIGEGGDVFVTSSGTGTVVALRGGAE